MWVRTRLRAHATSEAWRAAHRRLYEHLCATTKEGDQPTLEDLQPLYQAVVHGCQAGLHQQAFDEVGMERIRRGDEEYATRKLGAFGSSLGAIACFFEIPWSRFSPVALREADKAWLLTGASFCLRALGRLTEALEPMRAGLNMRTNQRDWQQAAISASYLSDLELTLGEVASALRDAELCVNYADRSGDAECKIAAFATHADALHQAGRRAEAEKRFFEAEALQAERQPAYPLLYSTFGVKYCDLLLTEAERGAWQLALDSSFIFCPESARASSLPVSCRATSERAAQALKKYADYAGTPLLDIALDHFTLGRAALYAASLESSHFAFGIRSDMDTAVTGLRRAGTTHHIPRALLTRAWLRFLTGARTGPESAQEDLDEAWEIAERGPMKLFLADIYLHRARLFFREAKYPWDSPVTDLAAAERLINDCGYHRRDEELADAKAVILRP